MARCEHICGRNEGYTHVKEGARMLQYELTRVWFILTVIYINVELIGLENRREEKMSKFYVISLCFTQAHALF